MPSGNPLENHAPSITPDRALEQAIFADLTRYATLSDSLSILCQTVEGQAPELVCSILILDYDQVHLFHGAAPSLPESFTKALDGIAIGSDVGPCGMAAYSAQPVMVSDLENDHLWPEHRKVALEHGLRACWAIPIPSKDGKVIGTFALYYREARLPTEHENQLVQWAVAMASLVLERKRAVDLAREQHDELQILLDAVPAMIWYKDKQNRILRANRAAAATANLGRRQIEERSVYDLYSTEAAKYYQDDLEVIETGRPKLGIFEPLRLASGETRWLITDKFPHHDPTGKLIGVIVFSRDVTEQHASDLARAEAETRFHTLVEQLPALIYVAEEGPEGHWSYVSFQIKNVLGYSSEEWIADRYAWGRHVHPDDKDRVLDHERACFDKNQRFVLEYRMITRDGKLIWVRDEATVLPAQVGKPRVMQGVILDITESRKIQESLHAVEARLAATINSSPLVVFALDADGIFTLSEGMGLQSLGLNPGEVVGRSVFDIYRDNPGILDSVRRALAGEEFSNTLEVPDAGQVFETRWTVQRDDTGKLSGVIGTSTNVTERKKAQDLAESTRERLSMALEASGLSLWDCDFESGQVYLGPGWSTMLGGEPEAKFSTMRELLSITHPDDKDLVYKVAVQMAAGETARYREQFRVQDSKGDWVWVESTGKVVERDQAGHAVRAIGTNLDISERKRAEARAQESEERLRLALSAADMGMWEWDMATNRATGDTSLYRILGVARDHFDGTLEECKAMIHPEDLDLCCESAKILVESKQPVHVEFRIFAPGGDVRWLSATGSVTLDVSGKAVRFQGLAQDITVRHELEEQLRRGQKMEALGQLAGGVAHDFNNLLTVIRGHAELLHSEVPPGTSVMRNATAIEKATDRAAAITRQLLAFGRKQVLQPRELDLTVVVPEISDMLRKLIGANIDLQIHLAAESLWVKADEGQIEQVVVNLIVNARDAMPDGGTVTVETSRVNVGQDLVKWKATLPEGNYVRLAVRDTGMGMDAATQARIFDPFFTTKAAGKGTGLGLSTVYGIVRQSGGWISVESEPGKGASFEVYLREVPAPPAPQRKEPAARRGAHGTETILLADDEAGIREMTVEYLSGKGYTVLAAEHGKRAIEIAQAHEGPIHVLVTDAMMPGIDGVTLARRVCEIRPGIKVLYVSGYSGGTSVLQAVIERGEAFLQKPFMLDGLARKVRELLG
jgi:two-component system, cell cycle sensor histidine kinase and response regulator CckA